MKSIVSFVFVGLSLTVASVAVGSSDRRIEELEEKMERLLAIIEVPNIKYDSHRTEEPTIVVRQDRMIVEQESSRNKVNGLQSELDALRNDYQRLRADFLRLEDTVSSGQPSITLEENTHKTVEWLKTTVTELRNEVTDVAHAMNASKLIAQSQEIEMDIGVLQGDGINIRKSLEELAVEQKRVKIEVDDLNTELRRRMEEQSILEPTEKIISSIDIFREAEEQVHTPRRHRRSSLHSEVDILNHFVKSLIQNQEILERNLHKIAVGRKTDNSNLEKIELELRSVLNRNSGVEEMKMRLDSVADKESKLENLLRDAASKVANIDKVQSSTLQLFEAMEGIEDKYDVSLHEMQTELSKLDAANQQLSIEVENLKEEEADEKGSLRNIQDKIQKLRDSILVEKEKASNELHVTEHGIAQIDSKESGTKASDEEHSIVSRIGEIQRLYEELLRALPKSCRDVKQSGISTLLPPGLERPLTASCDAETETGGWMVIQRRTNGEENFNRDWDSYKHGFGNPNAEYWLGNDNIHQLTQHNNSELRVDIWDIYGQYWWAQYDSFTVGDVSSGYVLHTDGFHGNASDALSYHEGMKFSSLDHDQDISNTNCAQSYQGGWWYSHCQHVNINGKYALGLTWYNSSENEWIAVSRVEMKIREKLR